MDLNLRNTDNTSKTQKYKLNTGSVASSTSGLETEWDYSGRKGRDGQKKKIGKANERKGTVERGKDGVRVR